jgi:hypothetical protein
MDRLLAIAGGQPLRSNDWDFIQDATAETIAALVGGLMGTTGACIVKGLVITVGDGEIAVSEGVLFKDAELFYVPSVLFEDHGETWSLYLTPSTTTGETRTFKDSSTHNVYQYRRYAVGYAASIPGGSIPFPGSNLLGLITQHVLGYVPAIPTQYVKYRTVSYASSALDQVVTLIPAAGVGKVIKVISIAAKINPVTPLNVADQNLNLFYGTDNTEIGVGIFPTSFLEATGEYVYDMLPSSLAMYKNQPVSAQLSAEDAPTGIANIQFYCFYVVISM